MTGGFCRHYFAPNVKPGCAASHKSPAGPFQKALIPPQVARPATDRLLERDECAGRYRGVMGLVYHGLAAMSTLA